MARRTLITALVASVLGAGFFIWIAGVRLIDPRQVGWMMRVADWQGYFLTWHLFRGEPWQWPPGRIASEYFPIGSSIGFTDVIPIVALLLKPWSAHLPDHFQYFGLYLLLSFALQGACAMPLLRWTDDVAVQLLGAFVFVLSPVLLDRVGHVALCSHWLIPLALVLYFRDARERLTATVARWIALVVMAALIQPYLWAMVLVIAAAATARAAITCGSERGIPRAAVFRRPM